MTKLNLHHKEVKKETNIMMFRCPECHKDSEFSKWIKSVNHAEHSICPSCKKEVKDTMVKRVKS